MSRASSSGTWNKSKDNTAKRKSNMDSQRGFDMLSRLCYCKTHGLKKCLYFTIALVYCLSAHAVETISPDEALLWDALRSGKHIGLLRHALAPGTGDPGHFKLRECATQRNLSAEGRAQATRIGNRMRENGIKSARVYSSQWCRCLDTAELLSFGDVTELPALNSFYQRDERHVPQTNALKEWLAGQTLDKPHILVTHRVNITALTKEYPASGELVVVKRSEDGTFSVAGTIETN